MTKECYRYRLRRISRARSQLPYRSKSRGLQASQVSACGHRTLLTVMVMMMMMMVLTCIAQSLPIIIAFSACVLRKCRNNDKGRKNHPSDLLLNAVRGCFPALKRKKMIRIRNVSLERMCTQTFLVQYKPHKKRQQLRWSTVL